MNRLRRALLPLWAGLAVVPAVLPATVPRTAEEWIAFLPGSGDWNQRLRDGSLPLLDPEALPGSAWLPDPLRFSDGRLVTGAADWPARRRELLALFEHYTTGVMPPPPSGMQVTDLRETKFGGVLQRTLQLAFGADSRARLHVELFVPEGPGPFPVFLTQANHRAWALVAASRGYLGCVYAGADVQDDTPGLSVLWPGTDASLLTRRAWAGSRCVDYLFTLPEVRCDQIAIAGHSRNGKQSLIAGAFDERIAAVISSSAGAGGSLPARLATESRFAEGIELGTRRYPQWYHPRLRFFTGRENRLPVDQHELIACLAPRACLISTAINDGVENVWMIEGTWREARRVYALFGRESALELRYRPGGHETRAEDIEGYIDWLDGKFGRGPVVPASQPIYPTYADWRRLSGEHIDPRQFPVVDPGRTPDSLAAWNDAKPARRARVTWALGEALPAPAGRASDYGSETGPWAEALLRNRVPEGIRKIPLNFGAYLAGDLYRPQADVTTKLPALVWLAPTTVAFGYTPSQAVLGREFYAEWVRAGYAVFAFDQIGTGRRVEEIQRFYERHPHASILGRTLADTRAAVDALRQQGFIDPQRIYVIGYGTGGMAALHAAALDERLAGAISIAGFFPMRSDTVDKGTGGIARWTEWLPFLPRLGAFIGQENRLPYDYDDLLALTAPRPVALIQPAIDYQSTADDVRASVARAEKIYALHQRTDALQLTEVPDYNHYGRKAADAVLRALEDFKSRTP